jgi:uncharacterized membrane protein YbhN (UPF0104 family)
VLVAQHLLNITLTGWMSQPGINWILRTGKALAISVRQPRAVIAAFLYSLAFTMVANLNCYCYATALGIVLPLYIYCVYVPLIALISTLPITINGFGLREAAYIFVFSTMHVPTAIALLLALLLDVQALFFATIGLCIYLYQPGVSST